MKNSKNIKALQRKVKTSTEVSSKPVIKVRLDYRTFITISNLSALKNWITRYPNAAVMTNFPANN